jgi:hypothetical protein
VPRPTRLPGVGYDLQLFAAVQPCAIGVHLKWHETSDRKLVQPGVVYAEDALGVPGRHPKTRPRRRDRPGSPRRCGTVRGPGPGRDQRNSGGLECCR